MPAAINYIQSGTNIGLNPGDSQYLVPDPFRNLSSPNLNIPFPSSTVIKLQPRKMSFSPTTLGNTVHIYTTPLVSDVANLVAYFGDWGCSMDLQEAPTFTLTVTAPWDTITSEDWWISDFASEQWEIVPNNGTKSILHNGLLASSFTTPTANGNYIILPDVYKVAVQRAYDNKAGYIALQSGSSVTNPQFIPYAQATLDYMRFGIDSVPIYTQTIRRSAVIDQRNTNNAFQKAIDLSHAQFRKETGTVNFLMSTPNLINAFDIPQDTVGSFMYPSYMKKITVQSYQQNVYQVYGSWLVKPPILNFITRNKIQLSQEFIWDEYIDKLYYIWSDPGDFQQVNSPSSSPNGFFPSS